jgi:hypothetical protein
LALDFTVRDHDSSFDGIDARHFGFDQVDAMVEHRVSQIERDVFRPAPAEGQPDEGGVKNETAAARYERDLMIVAQLLSQPFRHHEATKSTTKYKDLRHQFYRPTTNRHSVLCTGYTSSSFHDFA